MRLICTFTGQDRQSGQKGPYKPQIKDVPDGYAVWGIKTLHPHSHRDLSVTIEVTLKKADAKDIVERFHDEAFFYACIGCDIHLEQ